MERAGGNTRIFPSPLSISPEGVKEGGKEGGKHGKGKGEGEGEGERNKLHLKKARFFFLFLVL